MSTHDQTADSTPPAAAIAPDPGELRLEAIPVDPSVSDDVALVDIDLCGVCGTDVHLYAGAMPGASPSIFGHEWVGRVRAVGASVTDFRPGDRVTVGASAPCGQCPACQGGYTDYCQKVRDQARGAVPDAGRWGGFATYVMTSADRLVAVPDQVDDVAAAMLEPASVAYRAVRRSQAGVDDVVVVIGGGPIGLFAAQHARARGCRVVLIEPNGARRGIAEGLGTDLTLAPGPDADATILDLSEGRGADVVLECTGLPTVLAEAAGHLRPGGTVMVVGVPGAPVTFEVPSWIRGETTLRATMAYSRSDVLDTLDLLAAGRIRVTGMHTATVGLHNLSDLLEELDNAPGTQCKVLVSPKYRPQGEHR